MKTSRRTRWRDSVVPPEIVVGVLLGWGLLGLTALPLVVPWLTFDGGWLERFLVPTLGLAAGLPLVTWYAGRLGRRSSVGSRPMERLCKGLRALSWGTSVTVDVQVLAGERLRLWATDDGLPLDLRIEALAAGARDPRIGDPEFDRLMRVPRESLDAAVAVLEPRARRTLRLLLRHTSGLTLSDGAFELDIAAGRPEAEILGLAGKLVELAQGLRSRPEQRPAQLAHRVHSDPLPGVREVALRLLLTRYRDTGSAQRLAARFLSGDDPRLGLLAARILDRPGPIARFEQLLATAAGGLTLAPVEPDPDGGELALIRATGGELALGATDRTGELEFVVPGSEGQMPLLDVPGPGSLALEDR
ncbi:MAG: hypothetical protein GY898_19000 [Proteobacteria bacterium]|nr:hypothetical protein [Pseudomonadota bacterium]